MDNVVARIGRATPVARPASFWRPAPAHVTGIVTCCRLVLMANMSLAFAGDQLNICWRICWIKNVKCVQSGWCCLQRSGLRWHVVFRALFPREFVVNLDCLLFDSLIETFPVRLDKFVHSPCDSASST